MTGKLNNNGFNCIAAQVVVLPDGWGQTETLIKYIKFTLKIFLMF